ncbi:MAG: hypothetical protein RL596_2282 [Bacteroidota bacterium]
MHLMKRTLMQRMLIVFCWLQLSVMLASAQLTQSYIEPDAAFKQAKLLYQQEQFSLAYPLFKTLYNNGVKNSNMPDQVFAEAKYYYIICGLQLNEPAAATMAKGYIDLEHSVAHAQKTAYHLGVYYYHQQEFGDAIAYFDKTNIANLTNAQIAAMKFSKAYSYFVLQQFDKAKPLFNSIRQLPNNSNYVDANYYYGFLLFNEKNYAEAIQSFTIAEKDPDYQNIVPFYLAELYYFSGEKEKALNYAEFAIQKKGQYYDLQLKQLAGHILFEKRQFAKALPYLEAYVQTKDKVSREDVYELSYCYYEAKNWNKAIEGFKQIGSAQDSLAQNSMYLLADCYLKVDDPQNARTAFLFCYTNNSNPTQKEVSAFHYAKLSYELSYYDEAAKGFEKFINQYPASVYNYEAKELLISTLANTSSYKNALLLYDQLPNKTINALKLYPRILYGRIVELINDQQVAQADNLLDVLLQAQENGNYFSMANFWKGEIAYRTAKTDAAIGFMQQYLKAPMRNGEVNAQNARYILGYALLKNENYKLAKAQFELVAKSVSTAESNVEKDAVLRVADCLFMQKEYKQSLIIYDAAYNAGWNTADYALYQKAIIAGALNKQTDKLQLLAKLETEYPNSTYLPFAQMEAANAWLSDEAFEKALTPLYKVVNNPKASGLHPQGYLKLGIALFNLDKNDASLDQFKTLVSRYPNSTESDAAIEYIRNIFVEQQKPADYVGFMEKHGKPITVGEADSLSFRSAMIRYEAKDNAGAQSGFTEYILKYPDGRYKVESNYFLAEINIVQKNSAAALPFYTMVAKLAPNKYAERSILQAARIYYFDNKDYVNAAAYFEQLKKISLQQENRLEAMRGLVRCYFKTQQFTTAAPTAAELLLEKGIANDDKLMAGFVLAKNEQSAKNYDLALTQYKSLLLFGKSEITAETQYNIAFIQFGQEKLSDAEKSCFELIKKYGSYEHWVTRSYILIGDIYTKQKDYFNAEATLKSVADNAADEGLRKEASGKLAAVLIEKNKNAKVEAPKN